MKSNKKTNVMRILDANKINYKAYFSNDVDDNSRRERLLTQGNVFKTLVTEGKSRQFYVFVIPYDSSLNLKKAAFIVNEKSLNMILQKDLLKLTGYMHGGCSPIGMKKQYKTFIDESAKELSSIAISGGMVGSQIEVKSDNLKIVLDFEYANLV